MGIEDTFNEFVEGTGISISNVMNLIGGIVLLVIVCGICGVIIYFSVIKKKFDKRIIVWERINGVMQITKRDMASEITVPHAAIKLLFLRKLKSSFGKYLPRPTIQTGVNTYWYGLGKDGEWINIGVEDFDERRRMLGLKLDSTDLRNQRAALQKLMRENYRKEKWWERLAPYIALGILVLILGVCFWLIADKCLDAINLGNQNLVLAKEVAQLQKDILAGLDNVCSGSGIRKAG